VHFYTNYDLSPGLRFDLGEVGWNGLDIFREDMAMNGNKNKERKERLIERPLSSGVCVCVCVIHHDI